MKIELVNGRRLSEKQVSTALNIAQEKFAFGLEPSPGEYKTHKELDLIDKTNFAFREEFKELGIEDSFEEMNPFSIHFLDEYIYNGYYPDARGSAFTDSRFRMMVLNRHANPQRPQNNVFVFLHEAAHYFSKKTYKYLKQHDVLFAKSLGYGIDSDSEKRQGVFKGFNEAICDLSASRVQGRYFNLFFGDDANEREVNPMVGSYPEEIAVLSSIVEGIAKVKKENPKDVWERFYKGQFIGDFSPFKDIEKVFGRGSLKLLAGFGNETHDPNLTEEEKNQRRLKVINHFSK